MKNAIVAQSGGPSPVINSSLQGVIEACRNYPDSIETLFGSFHGIEGILTENIFSLSEQNADEVSLLRTTPASGVVGTCRYKLKENQTEDFERILKVFQAHNIGYFFYIGGNDSMDTAHKISELAKSKSVELVAVGVPKTIDNDLGDEEFTMIDHTPGYGSAARYWTNIIQNTNQENNGMCPSECVSVFQAMGRKAGFIPAAARLADPNRELPIQMYFAEANHNLESLAENVNKKLSETGRCIVIVSEGFDCGSIGEAKDGFGHIEYGASKTTVAQVVTNYLNKVGLSVRGQATGQVPGILQRSTSIYASTVDAKEAYEIGRKAVEIALKDGSGWMATILRKPSENYEVYYDKIPLEKVANSERYLPKNWITKDGLDVTDDFIKYAQPLIGTNWPNIPIENGIQRFAKFDIKCEEKKLNKYLPQTLRN